MKAVMTEVMTENLEGHKGIHNGKADFAAFVPDGQKGKIYLEKRGGLDKITIKA